MPSNWRGLPKAFGIVLLALMLLIGVLLIGVLLMVTPEWLRFG